MLPILHVLALWTSEDAEHTSALQHMVNIPGGLVPGAARGLLNTSQVYILYVSPDHCVSDIATVVRVLVLSLAFFPSSSLSSMTFFHKSKA
jgi:hypothetical protein